MARRTKPTKASQDSIDGLTLKIDEFIASAGGRFASQESVDRLTSRFDRLDEFISSAGGSFASQQSLDRLSSKFDRFAFDVERRLAGTKEDLDTVHAKLDHHTAVLDHVSGQLLDTRRSLLVFDSMLGEHRRRLTALESRQPPTGP